MWDSPITSAIAETALEHLTGHGPVVDLGCGTALVSGSLPREVIGVDSSPDMLRRAQRRQRITQAILAKAENSGLRDAAGDDVLICNLLHLHPDPSAVLLEATRICSPSGRIFVCWPIDGLTNTRMLRLDIGSGRSLLKSLLADWLRRLTGVASVMTRTHRNSSTQVETAVKAVILRQVLTDFIMFGCQRVIVLGTRDAAHDPSGTVLAASAPATVVPVGTIPFESDQEGVACEFVKYPTLAVGGSSEWRGLTPNRGRGINVSPAQAQDVQTSR